jgi:CheY-like chemotaxis protein
MKSVFSDTLLRRNKPILIVEDDKTTLRLARIICEQLGYDVVTATNGLEALDVCEMHSVSMILMDVQMPMMGGYETAFEIRQREAEQNVEPTAIIAVTGMVTPGSYLHSIQCGMNDCVKKPYTVLMLKELTESYIGSCKPQASKEIKTLCKEYVKHPSKKAL